MNEYQAKKEQVRQKAIDWKLETAQHPMSWGETAVWSWHFYTLGKRYGLLKEFRENGIC